MLSGHTLALIGVWWFLFLNTRLFPVLILRGDLGGLVMKGFARRQNCPAEGSGGRGSWTRLWNCRVWEQRRTSWGGRDRNMAGGGWLRSREGPWRPDCHDDPGTQGLTGSGKGIWLMVSQDAGPGWQSRATLPMGRSRYHSGL